jgi:hypothetical protein
LRRFIEAVCEAGGERPFIRDEWVSKPRTPVALVIDDHRRALKAELEAIENAVREETTDAEPWKPANEAELDALQVLLTTVPKTPDEAADLLDYLGSIDPISLGEKQTYSLLDGASKRPNSRILRQHARAFPAMIAEALRKMPRA